MKFKNIARMLMAAMLSVTMIGCSGDDRLILILNT